MNFDIFSFGIFFPTAAKCHVRHYMRYKPVNIKLKYEAFLIEVCLTVVCQHVQWIKLTTFGYNSAISATHLSHPSYNYCTWTVPDKAKLFMARMLHISTKNCTNR